MDTNNNQTGLHYQTPLPAQDDRPSVPMLPRLQNDGRLMPFQQNPGPYEYRAPEPIQGYSYPPLTPRSEYVPHGDGQQIPRGGQLNIQQGRNVDSNQQGGATRNPAIRQIGGPVPYYDQAPSHSGQASGHHNHNQAPNYHNQAPSYHIQVNVSQGQAPSYHVQVTVSQGQAPSYHVQVTVSQGQAPSYTGQGQSAGFYHGQAPDYYGQASGHQGPGNQQHEQQGPAHLPVQGAGHMQGYITPAQGNNTSHTHPAAYASQPNAPVAYMGASQTRTPAAFASRPQVPAAGMGDSQPHTPAAPATPATPAPAVNREGTRFVPWFTLRPGRGGHHDG